MWHLIVILLCGSATASKIKYDTSATRLPGKINVHLVPHSHDDAGWLKTWDQYYYGWRQDIQQGGIQYVITSIVQALRDNSDRKFNYAEMSFFSRWWEDQDENMQALVKQLVRDGQLDFINGGFVQNDEAASHFVAMIDQTTRGHRFLNKTFGKIPRVGWQIDPFGHSATQASLMSGALGFDALFFGRADYQDMNARRIRKEFEFVWRGSQSWGTSADIFTHNYPSGNYGAPLGFMWEWGSRDPPIIDDPESPDYNVPERVQWFVGQVLAWLVTVRGNDVMFAMGTDFSYTCANSWYMNMDKLIHYVNLDGRVNVFYSSPAAYVDAKRSYADVAWPLRTADFFPYADCPNCYWTGYFTSRPASKGYIRSCTSYLQAARQLAVMAELSPEESDTDKLWKAVSVTQHHDSVTGTEKQPVANDYHRLLYRGWVQAAGVVERAILRLMFPPLQQQGDLSGRRLQGRMAEPIPRPREHHQGQTGTAAGGPPGIQLQQCPLLNASACGASVAATRAGAQLLLVAYNPLPHARVVPLRLPLAGDAPALYSVEDSSGAAIPSAVVPLDSASLNLQAALLSAGLLPGSQPGDAARSLGAADLHFIATLPPLGYAAFHLRPDRPAALAAESLTLVSLPTNNGSDLVVSNDVLMLTLDGVTGEPRGLSAVDGSWSTPLRVEMMWYRSSDGNETAAHGLGSGAYIFRPHQDAREAQRIVVEGGVQVEVLTGRELSEVRLNYGEWAALTVRLRRGHPHLELEWTVGPLPFDGIGREVITRITTDIQSGGVLFHDANGRELQRRQRDTRPTWQLEVHEPVAGNYYPMTAASYLAQTGGLALVLATDRSQGVASLQDGQLEVMLHRKTVQDDQRGVGEELAETLCGCRGCECAPLRVRGRHLLAVTPATAAPRTARRLAAALNDPPLTLFAALPTPTPAAALAQHGAEEAVAVGGTAEEGSDGGRGGGAEGVLKGAVLRRSGMKDPGGLPENVQVVTLMTLEHGKVLLRVGHAYQSGEDDELSKPVCVNLSDLLTQRIVSVLELTLSAAQARSQLRPRQHWPLEPSEAPLGHYSDETPNQEYQTGYAIVGEDADETSRVTSNAGGRNSESSETLARAAAALSCIWHWVLSLGQRRLASVPSQGQAMAPEPEEASESAVVRDRVELSDLELDYELGLATDLGPDLGRGTDSGLNNAGDLQSALAGTLNARLSHNASAFTVVAGSPHDAVTAAAAAAAAPLSVAAAQQVVCEGRGNDQVREGAKAQSGSSQQRGDGAYDSQVGLGGWEEPWVADGAAAEDHSLARPVAVQGSSSGAPQEEYGHTENGGEASARVLGTRPTPLRKRRPAEPTARPQYDIWSHTGDQPPFIMELFPMEIRTFEVVLEH